MLTILWDSDDPRWLKNDMGWNVVPDGLREMLRWIAERYSNPVIYITENGSAEVDSEEPELLLYDENRQKFIKSHIQASSDAIQNHGVNLKGYFAWSLLDNFEWQYGYQRRFGICHVNFTTLERSPRFSAMWYSRTIQSDGDNIWSDESIDKKIFFNNHGPRKLEHAQSFLQIDHLL